jgi:hypothetical protein
MKTITIDNIEYELILVRKSNVILDMKLEIYHKDIGVLKYVDAVKEVEKLGDGWRIPALEELRIMYANKDKVPNLCLTASGSDYPDWYWSSTEHRNNPSYVHNVRFSDGDGCWVRKDNGRLSCRPVRLVAAPGS